MDLLLRQSGPTLKGSRIQTLTIVSIYGFFYLNQVIFLQFLAQNGVIQEHRHSWSRKNISLSIFEKPYLTFEFLSYPILTNNALFIVFLTYYVGSGCGYLLSALLSQNLSPRKGLIIFSFVHVILSFISALCPIYWAFTGFRFFSGLLTGAAGHCLLCILIDWSYYKFNAITGHHINFGKILALFLYSISLLMAHLAAPWRTILMAQGILTFIGFILTLLCVHQSPRWLKEQNYLQLLIEEGKAFSRRQNYSGRPLLDHDYNANEPSCDLKQTTSELERICLIIAYGFSSIAELLVQTNHKEVRTNFQYHVLILAGCYFFAYILAIPSRRFPRFGVSSSAVFGAIITFLLILIKHRPIATWIFHSFKVLLAISAHQLLFMTLLNTSTPFDDPTIAQLVHSRIKLVVLSEFFAGLIFRPLGFYLQITYGTKSLYHNLALIVCFIATIIFGAISCPSRRKSDIFGGKDSQEIREEVVMERCETAKTISQLRSAG
ncbi:unnamed protein product [Bursaphelenchus xylophilus]|uniref:(pine wood nematode) hypothetical protein n=1 Tax=Bursaphelenchus xylophilus TaxID=6326 RepID=A0A7I8X5K7_BURXY|nr:unnamed protein product [Bursaphelenchus xylophilus]CAG9122467.1 unnamed protein product [Bursaphelenchus xylophilus]